MAKWDLSKLPEGRKPLDDAWFKERAQMQDRIKELEAKLAKAVGLVDDMLEWGTWYGLALSEILQRRAELKGEK